MSKTNQSLSITRRAQKCLLEDELALSHDEAFQQAYGSHTSHLRRGTLRSRVSDEAAARAVACISACEGLPLEGLLGGGVQELIQAVHAAERLLGGRLVGVDPEAGMVRDQLRKAMRKLAIR